MQEIKPLTSLRGLFALWVVALHVRVFAPFGVPDILWITKKGYLAVDFFFVLSGFVLAASYGRKFVGAKAGGAKPGDAKAWGAYVHFMVRRWGRLFPLHLAVLAACILEAVLFEQRHFPAGQIAGEAALVQRWDLWSVPAAAINGPDWSISTEWAANLLFPAFVWIALKGTWVRSMAALGGSVALLVYAAGRHLWTLDIAEANSILPLLRCFGDFALGLLAYRYRDALALLKSDEAVLAMVVAGYGALVVKASDLIVVAIMVPALIGVAGNRGILARRLSAPPLHWLGTISYSIYLTHVPILIAVRKLAASMPTLGLETLIYLGGGLTAMLAVSAVTYRLIEVPARKWIGAAATKFPRARARRAAAAVE